MDNKSPQIVEKVIIEDAAKKSDNKGLLIAIIAIGVFLLLGVLGIVLWLIFRPKNGNGSGSGGNGSGDGGSGSGGSGSGGSGDGGSGSGGSGNGNGSGSGGSGNGNGSGSGSGGVLTIPSSTPFRVTSLQPFVSGDITISLVNGVMFYKRSNGNQYSVYDSYDNVDRVDFNGRSLDFYQNNLLKFKVVPKYDKKIEDEEYSYKNSFFTMKVEEITNAVRLSFIVENDPQSTGLVAWQSNTNNQNDGEQEVYKGTIVFDDNYYYLIFTRDNRIQVHDIVNNTITDDIIIPNQDDNANIVLITTKVDNRSYILITENNSLLTREIIMQIELLGDFDISNGKLNIVSS